MDCKFVVGQKVVCINDEISFGEVPGISYTNYFGLDGLKKGEIYTISGINIEESSRGGVIVILKEIVRPLKTKPGVKINHCAGFCALRFKPLEEKKKSTETGMTILREILKKGNIPVEEPKELVKLKKLEKI